MSMILRTFVATCCAVMVVACGAEDPVSAPQNGSIRGKVLSARSLTSIENALVTTVPATSSVRTNAEGDYTISDVPAGTYAVHAERPDSGVGTTTINVLAGRETPADVLLSRSADTTGSISGRVTDDKGAAVSDVSITTLPVLSSVRTNSDGRFQFSNVAPGVYVVKARKDGVGFGEVQVSVTVGALATADITLSPQDPLLGMIRGRVTNRATGANLKDVRVRLVGTAVSVSTNADGTYQFNNVTPGIVSLEFEWESWTKIYSIEVKTNEVTVLNVRAGQSSVVPAITNGLFAFYPCDGSAEDLSEFGRDASIVSGTFGTNREGVPGAALLCNGQTALVMPPADDLNSAPLTVAFWVRLDETTETLIGGKYLHPSGNGWILLVENGRLVTAFFSGNFIGPRIDGPSVTGLEGTWFHIAYSVGPSGSAIFINGVLAAQGGGFTSSSTSSQPARFGSLVTNLAGFRGVNGAIDDIYVFRRALSAQEIDLLYRAD